MESTQSDIDYDKTNESLESSFEATPVRRESRKRRSRSQNLDTSRGTVRFEHTSIIKEEVRINIC